MCLKKKLDLCLLLVFNLVSHYCLDIYVYNMKEYHGSQELVPSISIFFPHKLLES